MTVCTTIGELRESLAAIRSQGDPIGLVPTMGALHAGHADLIRRSVAESATVVSIFVNPTQFGPNEDFDRYPRDPDADLAICRQMGASIVFMPTVEEMYPAAGSVSFALRGLNAHLCGAHRPGHFEGVCLIVSKLFHAVQPDIAWFGQKDIQQYVILERMARELLLPVRMRMAPTVREADGLAMSSRNRYLSPQDRARAPLLHEALSHVAEALTGLADGRTPGQGPSDASSKTPSETPVRSQDAYTGVEAIIRRERDRLVSNGFRIDYFDVYDRETLQPASGVSEHGRIVAAAAHLGSTRLIDNLLIAP